MASTNYSDVVDDDSNWVDPNPTYATLLGAAGGAAGTNRSDAQQHLVNLAKHSPTLLAFILNGDPGHIHVGCAPTNFPAAIGAATPFDNRKLVQNPNNNDTPN